MATAVALRRLQLIQEELDLEAELGTDEELIDLPGIEKEFVKVGKAYGTRKGVWSAAWRSVGVSVQVLQKAGIPAALADSSLVSSCVQEPGDLRSAWSASG